MSVKKHVFSLMLLVLLAALALTACGGDAQEGQGDTGEATPAMADGDNAAAEDVLKIRVAAQPTSGQVFQFIAEKHGFNAEEGIEVETVSYTHLDVYKRQPLCALSQRCCSRRAARNHFWRPRGPACIPAVLTYSANKDRS